VSDKFEDFLQRLEMPMPEPKIVGMVDKAIDVQMACRSFRLFFKFDQEF
jgi:hypothetical protein